MLHLVHCGLGGKVETLVVLAAGTGFGTRNLLCRMRFQLDIVGLTSTEFGFWNQPPPEGLISFLYWSCSG